MEDKNNRIPDISGDALDTENEPDSGETAGRTDGESRVGQPAGAEALWKSIRARAANGFQGTGRSSASEHAQSTRKKRDGTPAEEPMRHRTQSAARRRQIEERRRRNRMIYRARVIAFFGVCTIVIVLIIIGLIRVISGLTGGNRGNNATQVTKAETPVTVAETEVQTEDISDAAPVDSTEIETIAETTATAAADSTGVTVYATQTVNVRKEPGTDAEILGKLEAGDSVTRISEQDGWSTVQYNGETAYIKSDYLTTETPSEAATTAASDRTASSAASAVSAVGSYWTGDLSTLSTDPVNFGYAEENRDSNMIPTDWAWYESQWGQFNVDWIQDTSKPVIYLTMDEGFGNDQTATELDILKEKGVNVTFFLTKNFVDDRPDLVQRMIDEGHQLGNHTCTHPDMTSLSVDDQTSQIETLNNQMQEQFGYQMKLFRFPEGKYSAEALGLVDNLGMKTVFWTYAYLDYDTDNQPAVDESLQAALSHLHNGAIYLLHAKSQTNMEMLADFIDGARAKGYEFGTYPLTDN